MNLAGIIEHSSIQVGRKFESALALFVFYRFALPRLRPKGGK